MAVGVSTTPETRLSGVSPTRTMSTASPPSILETTWPPPRYCGSTFQPGCFFSNCATSASNGGRGLEIAAAQYCDHDARDRGRVFQVHANTLQTLVCN